MSLKSRWGLNTVQISWFRLWRVLGVSILLTSLSSALGHPDLIEQISRVSERIENEPKNAGLYLQRAELHRRHSDLQAAHADVAQAERIGAGRARTLALEAQILFDERDLPKALMAADKSLQFEPRQPALLALRGKWLAESGRQVEAVADFTKSIHYSTNPSPDVLLERAQVQAEMGDLNGAVGGLDEGLKALGAIPSLELAAIEYERRQKHFEGALERLAEMIRRYPVKEPWLALRGELLEQAGHYPEAEAAFSAVVEGLEKYPAYRRGIGLNKELNERARAGLIRVKNRRMAQSVSRAEP